jgi:hypothetical protein
MKRPSLLRTTFRAFQFYPELFEFEVRKECFLAPLQRPRLSQRYVEVNRDHIVESSFEAFRPFTSDQFRQGFRIKFENEAGVDAGGPIREWFSLLVDGLFDPAFGLFQVSPNGINYQPSASSSSARSDHLEYFEFTGRILARALMSDIPVAAPLVSSVAKFLLQRPLSLRDMDSLDHAKYQSMKAMLDDIADPMLSFMVNVDDGSGEADELKTGGQDIDVTNETKPEFVALSVKYILHDQIEEQLKALAKGFYSLIPASEIRNFSVDELDFLICGTSKIDPSAIEPLCDCVAPYSPEHPVIRMFFDEIRHWEQADLERLLRFTTGCPRIPVGRRSSPTPTRITIGQPDTPDTHAVPVVHTCSLHLELPPYETPEVMHEKLLYAVRECNTFEKV